MKIYINIFYQFIIIKIYPNKFGIFLTKDILIIYMKIIVIALGIVGAYGLHFFKRGTRRSAA